MQKILRYFLIFIIFVAGLGGCISLIRSTMGQGTDFLVFWRAGRAIIEGTNIYVLDGVGGMVFKYPPWIAAFFVPIALVPFEGAKMIWGTLSVMCLLWMFYLVKKLSNARTGIVLFLGFLYWGIWVVHALDGQIAIPMLAITLAALAAPRKEKSTRFLDAVSVIALSTKIFTVFPWIVNFKRLLKKATVVWVLAIVSLSTLWVASRTSPGESLSQSMITLTQGWAEAASSGAKYLPAGLTRGRKNPSLSSFTCRLLNIPAEDTQTEVVISILFFALVVLLLWYHRKESIFMCFALAFAFTPVAHPLPWLHLFSWTFPFAVIVTDQIFTRWRQPASLVLVIALTLITLSSVRVFGEFGDWLEWHAAKGFGVVCLYIAWRMSFWSLSSRSKA